MDRGALGVAGYSSHERCSRQNMLRMNFSKQSSMDFQGAQLRPFSAKNLKFDTADGRCLGPIIKSCDADWFGEFRCVVGQYLRNRAMFKPRSLDGNYIGVSAGNFVDKKSAPVPIYDAQINFDEVFRVSIDGWKSVAKNEIRLFSLFFDLIIEREDRDACSSSSSPTTQRANPFSEAGAVILAVSAISELGEAVQPNEGCQRTHEAKRDPQRQIAVPIPTHERMRSTSSPSLARAAA